MLKEISHFVCTEKLPGYALLVATGVLACSSDLEIYSERLSHYLMETLKCGSAVVCVICDLWQEKTDVQGYPRVFTGHLVLDHTPLMEHTVGGGQMFPEPISEHPQLIHAAALGCLLGP